MIRRQRLARSAQSPACPFTRRGILRGLPVSRLCWTRVSSGLSITSDIGGNALLLNRGSSREPGHHEGIGKPLIQRCFRTDTKSSTMGAVPGAPARRLISASIFSWPETRRGWIFPGGRPTSAQVAGAHFGRNSVRAPIRPRRQLGSSLAIVERSGPLALSSS
jgi:hypothetical protein